MPRVLDLYSGMGGLSLGFALALNDVEIFGLDIDKHAVETYNHNLKRFNTEATVQDVLKWEPKGEFDIVVGGVPCFPPDSLVVASSGLKEIKNMREGDAVFTHKGNLRAVSRVMKRYYKGKLVALRISLMKIPIYMTPDHPLYVINAIPCSLGINKPCIPTCPHVGAERARNQKTRNGVKTYVRRCKRCFASYKPEWILAEQAKPHRTFVAVPLAQESLSPPPNIPLEPEMWYMFGLYIAEGTPYIKHTFKNERDKEKGIRRPSYEVYFSLGKHETKLISKLVTNLKRLGFNPIIREQTKSCVRVTVFSKKLYDLVFSAFGKYSNEKTIPLWVLRLPKECREAFLEGIRDGDGSKDALVVTVNPNIAFAVWLLTLSLGKPASIQRVKMPPRKTIEGRTVNQSPYLFRVREINRRDYVKVGRYWFDGNYVFLEVLKKDYMEYDGEVYNLEVEEDNSYTVWGVAVHNCQPYSLANTRKRGKDHELYPTLPRFFDIVLELKPKAFLMENVKGLVTARHKPLLNEQLKRVEGEYVIKHQVLNAAYYGVPQRRERLFVLGIRKDLGATPSFPPPTHGEEEKVTLAGKLYRWVTVREAIGDLLLVPPQGLVLTHKRSLTERVVEGTWRPTFTSEEPSFTVTDSGIRVLNPEQVERIKREREDTSRHLAKMEFPDSLDEPSRTVSSHTVEGTKRETIVVPVPTEHVGANVKTNVANPKGSGDASKVPNRLDLPAKTVLKGGGSGGAIPPLVELPTEHVMTEKGGWDSPKSDWGSRVMDADRPSYTVTEKHRSGQLVPVPPTAEEGMGRSSPALVADARIYATGRREHGTDAEKGCYRRLTVRECLRLQSFPDWWSFPQGVSTSRKYKLVGEAVPPSLAYRLAVHVGRLMGWEAREPPKPEEWQLPYFKRMFADYLADGGEE